MSYERRASHRTRHISLQHPRTLYDNFFHDKFIKVLAVQCGTRNRTTDELRYRLRRALWQELERDERLRDRLTLHQIRHETNLARCLIVTINRSACHNYFAGAFPPEEDPPLAGADALAAGAAAADFADAISDS